MMLDRVTDRLTAWVSGISWLLRLNRRLEYSAARWRPVRVTLAVLAAVTRNDAQQLIAGVAYYGMVALVPISVAIFQLLGIALGEDRTRDWYALITGGVLPPNVDLAGLVITGDTRAAGITGLFALLGLGWGSYKLFGAVGVVVNRMWGIEPAQVGILGKMRQFMLMTANAVVLFASSVLTYVMSQDVAPLAVREFNLAGFPHSLPTEIAPGWSNVLAGLLAGAAFLMVYRYIPERPVRWRWAAMGALVAGVALQLVNISVAIFISYLAPSHLLYGPLATVLIILVWLFASAVTLASGAAFAAYGQNVYDGDGPTPGPGWFLK